MNLKIFPLPHRTSELIQALRLQMQRTRIQRGCIDCRLSQDTLEPNKVLYQEEWTSWEMIEKNILSERFGWILELMELSVETPELSFCDVHETRGIDYVKELRGSKNLGEHSI